MINQIELLNQAFQLLSTPDNWDEIQTWYQGLESSQQLLLWTSYTPYLMEISVLHQRADFFKFICNNNLNGVVNYIYLSQFQILHTILRFQNTTLFDILFENMPEHAQGQILQHVYLLAFNLLQDNNLFYFIKILKLSPRYISRILIFNDALLIHLAIQKRVVGVFDYILTHLSTEIPSILRENHYSLIKHLFTQGNISYISRIFDLFPELEDELIEMDDYKLFQIAANCHHLDVLKFLVARRGHLVFNMIEGNDFEGFLNACHRGHEDVIKQIIEWWSTHEEPLKLLTQENFLSLQVMLGVVDEDTIISFINRASGELIKNARIDYRCDLFQEAVLQGCHRVAHILLKMYQNEDVDISLSLISAFQQIEVRTDFDLFKEIVSIFDDEVIMDSFGVDGFVRLIDIFDQGHFRELDFIFGRLQDVNNYRTCLNVLANHAPEPSKYLEAHRLLAGIQEFTLAVDKKVLPGFQSIIDQYDQKHQEAVAFYLNEFIANLQVFPKHFFLNLKDLKPLIEKLLRFSSEPINHFQFLNLNFTVLKLIIEKAPLGMPLLEIKKWRDHYSYLNCLSASINRNHLALLRNIQFDFEVEALKPESSHLLASTLLSIHQKYESQLSEPQKSKINRLILTLRADSDLIPLFLNTDLVTFYEHHTWISYQTMIEIAQDIIWSDTENDTQHQFLVDILKQKNYHPTAVDFLTIIPRFCRKLEERYPSLQICLFEHLLTEKRPELKILPIDIEHLDEAKIRYFIRSHHLKFDYSSHIQLHFLGEIITMLSASEQAAAAGPGHHI
jgi:hypothetical protein